MQAGNFRRTLGAGLVVIVSMTMAAGQKLSRASGVIPANTVLRIIRAEDERRRDEGVIALLGAKDPNVRKRAALALGRIGDERDVAALINILNTDRHNEVRQMAAFALGEIESAAGADALIAVLDERDQLATTRAQTVEALGKIGAALLSSAPAPGAQTDQPKSEDKTLTKIRLAILDVLKFEAGRRSKPDRLTILMGLTAALRARPEGSGAVITSFLGYSDARIVADALNTMARLRLKDGSDQVRQLLGNGDPIVRANAARVIGAAEDKEAFDALLSRAQHDTDLRVRVSAIRALGSLKNARAAALLTRRGSELFRLAHLNLNGMSRNEGIEILSALGVILAGRVRADAEDQVYALAEMSGRIRAMTSENIPEEEVASARWNPTTHLEYLKEFEARARTDDQLLKIFYGFRSMSARAAGLAELGRIKPQPPESIAKEAQSLLLKMLNDRRTPVFAIPAILNAYVVFKPSDLGNLLRRYIEHADVVVRGTAADLLADQPPSEPNTRALMAALPRALRDTDLNDAALSILDALAKQKSAAANDAIWTALDSSDILIRRRAVSLLKANGVGDFSNRIGFVKTRNTDADYRRAMARIGRKVTATVVTSKGSFVIEFLPEQAPLAVDNFVQLARKGYFNGQTVPRVVPNFVIQTGDPRGDQNGGPGYQIRCEINEAPYDRGAVGMALSGKDTGGSQWFVTHSPQPHLDGGYTVFGRVISGLEVVDNIARGDTIRRIVVNER